MATTAIVVVGIIIVASAFYPACKLVGRVMELDFSIDGIFDEDAMARRGTATQATEKNNGKQEEI